MSSTEPPRRRYNIGAWKVPFAQRTIAHEVLTSPTAADERGYLNVLGASTPDDHEQFSVGAKVAYSIELTEAEAERFATASNVRYVEEAQEYFPQRGVGRPTGTAPVPTLDTLAWMRTRYVDLRRWHGRDVPVAVLDQGTTKAVRDAMGFTLVARTVTSGIALGPGQELVNPDHGHGCLVAPNAVPAGGLLLDAIISGETGTASDSAQAAGITWAVDNGAKVINISFGGAPGVPPQVIQDAVGYAQDNGGVQITLSAGNDDLPDLASPSSVSRLFANAHSSIAFNQVTDRRALFSNHHADGSGCAPGENVESFDIHGNRRTWDGTSASAPHMAQLMARALTEGQFTPAQVGAAFKSNTRDTGAGADQQGGGAYDLHRTLAALGVTTSVGAGVASPAFVASVSSSGITSLVSVPIVSGVQVDDMQIMVVLSAPSNAEDYAHPDGWTELTNSEWTTGRERAVEGSLIVDNIHLRVLTRPYTVDQPVSQTLRFLGNKWAATWTAVVRAAGGMDPERFVPIVRTGTGTAVTAVPVSPASNNDLQVCVFAQLFGTGAATTASLSLPAGLTQRALRRPTSDDKGWVLLTTTRQLTDGNRTPSYVSTSNSTNAGDLWASATFTVPSGVAAIAPVTQTEPTGSPGAFLPFLPRG